MSDYRNLPQKLENLGLDIASPADTLKPGKYTRLVNVRNSLEGVLSSRNGLTSTYALGAGSGVVHTIRRLDSAGILFGRGLDLFRNTGLLTQPFVPSGNPRTTARFRSALTGTTLTYVADSLGLIKIKSDGTILKWGITGPVGTVAAAVVPAGNLVGDYDWRYTYYSSLTGAESNPSDVATSVTFASQQAGLTGLLASADPQVDLKRLYRRGGTIADWVLLDSIPNATLVYTDNIADSDLALASILIEDNDVPFTTVDVNGNTLKETPLPYIWGPFIGKYIFATGDPNRPGYAYWTNPEQPDAASSANSLSVTDPGEPLLTGFIFNDNPFIWTRDNLHALDYGGPTATPTFVPRLVSIGVGLSAPFGFCVAKIAVFFTAKDGIYATDCQSNIKSITNDSIRPLFLGRAAGGYQPIDWTQQNDIRLFYASQELHFFFKDTAGDYQHLVYDLFFDRWRGFESAVAAHNMGYGDENQIAYSLILAGTNSTIYSANDTLLDDGVAIQCQARTGAMDAGAPLTDKEWGSVLMDFDPGGGTIVVTPFLDAESSSLPSTNITGSARNLYQIPLLDTYSRNISFDMSWSGDGILYQDLLLFRLDEERVTHWELPETSHGLPSGWMHIRDAYFCLRSSADVTLTHSIDGVSYTYTLPSTAGERRRIHLYLAPVRGKMFRYELNSSLPFRFYGEDTQLFVKPWNSAITYQGISPFIAPGQATFLRKEAGT